jgi:WD40 repeat protein
MLPALFQYSAWRLLISCLFGVLLPIGFFFSTAIPVFGQPADSMVDPLPAAAVARLGAAQLPHEFDNQVAVLPVFSSDGRYLASSDGQTVFLWNPRTGQIVNQWRDPNWGCVRRLAMSPDGWRIAIATSRGTAVAKLTGESKPEVCNRWYADKCRLKGWFAFTPDGKNLVSLELDGEIRNIDIARKEARRAEYRNSHILAGLSRDGKSLTIWNQETIEHWDPTQLRRVSTNQFPYFSKFGTLRISPDGSLFAINLSDGGVIFWDTAASKVVGKLEDPKLDSDGGMQFTADGRRLVTVSRTNGKITVAIWAVSSGKLEKSFEMPVNQAGEPILSPDGDLIAFARPTREIFLKSLKTGKAPFDDGRIWANSAAVISREPGLESIPLAIHFASQKRVIAAGADRICSWDRVSTKLLRAIKGIVGGNGLVVPADGDSVIASVPSKGPTQFDLKTGRSLGRFVLPRSLSGGEYSISLSSSGHTLFGFADLGPAQGFVSVRWDLASRKILTEHSQPGKDVIGFDLESPYKLAGPYVAEINQPVTAVSELDFTQFTIAPGLIIVRDPTNAHAIRTLATRGSPDLLWANRSILFALTRPRTDDDGIRKTESQSIIEAWEILSGEKIVDWTVPSATEFAFSPNHQTIALAQPNAILVRSLDGGQTITLNTSTKTCCLAFSADGRWMASGHEDTTVLIWDFSRILHEPPKAHSLTNDERERCWRDLAGDAKASIYASTRLKSDSRATVALLRERLKPIESVDSSRLNSLLADLESRKFSVREAATQRLADLGERIQGTLKKALNVSSSAESRQRLSRLLSNSTRIPSPERRRQLRAIELLEQIASPEAGAVLLQLSKGDPEARETQAATDALIQLGPQRVK